MQGAAVELARYVLWIAIVAVAIVGGVAVGTALHTWEHPEQPLVVGPSAIVRGAYEYLARHGDYPPDGLVRAHAGRRTAWDDVLIANDRCPGGGPYSFRHAPPFLEIDCESDLRVFVRVPAFGDRIR